MEKLKLSLYIGLPLFWMMVFLLPANIPAYLGPLIHLDVVPIFAMFVIHDGLLLRNFDGDIHDTFEGLTFIMAHIVFWVPVAHYINKFWKRHERKSKKELGL